MTYQSYLIKGVLIIHNKCSQADIAHNSVNEGGRCDQTIGSNVSEAIVRCWLWTNEQLWKWMVEFLSMLQGCGIKIDRVNLILVAKSIIKFNSLRAIAPWVTSSWAIIFCVELASTSVSLYTLDRPATTNSLRLLPLVYILWVDQPPQIACVYFR